MTISSAVRKAGPFEGNDAATSFPFTFKVFTTADLVVLYSDGTTETTLTLDLHYSVALNADQDVSPGGTVTYPRSGDPLTAGDTLTFASNVSETQAVALANRGGFYPKVIENALDRAVVLVQQLRLQLSRVITYPLSDDTPVSELPIASVRANSLLSFDADGAPRAYIPSAQSAAAVMIALLTSAGASMIGFIQAGVGAVARTVQARLRDRVDVKDFGAVCDGATDDSAAVQLAVNYALSFIRAKTLIVSGRCRLASSIIIDRLVDTTASEFRIVGEGDGAGFYATGAVTFFDSSIAVTTDPKSEFVTFENIQFESSSIFNAAYVVSPKFLRMKCINCNFRLIRYVTSAIYQQTVYFFGCNIRNNPANFITCDGLYDVLFDGCIIENANTIVRCVSTVRGTNQLRFHLCVIEGMGSSIVIANGVIATINMCHLEANFSPEFNFFAGGLANVSVNATNNFIYNPSGQSFYYGATAQIKSSGNRSFPNFLHGNANGVFTSTNDNATDQAAPGGTDKLTDVDMPVTIGGFRSNTTEALFENLETTGILGLGLPAQAIARMIVRGVGNTNATRSGIWLTLAGLDSMSIFDDRSVKCFGAWSCNSATPQGPVALAGAAVDLPTGLVLLNEIRGLVIANGQAT